MGESSVGPYIPHALVSNYADLSNYPLFTVVAQLGISLFNLAYVNNALIDMAVKTCCGKGPSDDSQEVKLQKEKDSKINFKIGNKMTTVDSISAKLAWKDTMK